MLPAATILLVFLAYPLFLGIWLSMTDTTIGRAGVFIGLENFAWLWDDRVFWLSVFNTFLYTVVASVLKFALGLWLALLLNRHLPFKSFFRAIVLLPWIVPTVLSAIARSEEHTSALQSLMRISYAVFCLKKKKSTEENNTDTY